MFVDVSFQDLGGFGWQLTLPIDALSKDSVCADVALSDHQFLTCDCLLD